VSAVPGPPRASTAHRASLLVAVPLVAAILLNLVQFRAIDENTLDSFDAVHRNGTADILDLSYRECAWCRDRYGLHLALGIVAPGATVLIPTPGPHADRRYDAEEFTLRLYALADVASVRHVAYPRADLLLATDGAPGLDPAPWFVARGEGGAKGPPWAVAVDPARRAAAVPGGDPDSFLPGALARREAFGTPGGEFLILRWQQPRPGSDHEYQDVAVETSLLPDRVRAELAR
jgi:hypothetical protein